MRWIFRTPRTASLAVALAFAMSFAAEWSGGLAAVTGAFLAGLLVPASPQHSAMREDVRALVQSFFAPLFFVSIGLQIDAWSAGGALGFFLLLLLVAVLGKVAGCGLGAWWNGLDGRASLTVGVGMIPRGEVGLIAASAGWAAGLVSAEVYSLVVVLVLITTLVTPVLLRLLFSPGGLPDLPNANEEAEV
jgi:Kef-type K+ transport system membrane component KefB